MHSNSLSIPSRTLVSAISYLDSVGRSRIRTVSREFRNAVDVASKSSFFCVGYSVSLTQLSSFTSWFPTLTCVTLDIATSEEAAGLLGVVFACCPKLNHVEIYTRQSDGTVVLPHVVSTGHLSRTLSKSRRDVVTVRQSRTLVLDVSSADELLIAKVSHLLQTHHFRTVALFLKGVSQSESAIADLISLVGICVGSDNKVSSVVHLDICGKDAIVDCRIQGAVAPAVVRSQKTFSYLGGSVFDDLSFTEFAKLRSRCTVLNIGVCRVYEFLASVTATPTTIPA